jgi:hypothetical protein
MGQACEEWKSSCWVTARMTTQAKQAQTDLPRPVRRLCFLTGSTRQLVFSPWPHTCQVEPRVAGHLPSPSRKYSLDACKPDKLEFAGSFFCRECLIAAGAAIG